MDRKRIKEITEELRYHSNSIELLLDECGEKYYELKYLNDSTEKAGIATDGSQKFKTIHYIEYDFVEYKISDEQWSLISYIEQTKSAANYQFNAPNLIDYELPLKAGIELEERFDVIFRYKAP